VLTIPGPGPRQTPVPRRPYPARAGRLLLGMQLRCTLSLRPRQRAALRSPREQRSTRAGPARGEAAAAASLGRARPLVRSSLVRRLRGARPCLRPRPDTRLIKASTDQGAGPAACAPPGTTSGHGLRDSLSARSSAFAEQPVRKSRRDPRKITRSSSTLLGFAEGTFV